MKKRLGLRFKSPKKFLEKIAKAKYGSILLTCHPNADLDSVGSALALRQLLLTILKVKVDVGALEGIDSTAKKVLIELDYLKDVKFNPELNYDAYILIDTSTLKQLKEAGSLIINKPIFIVDHHTVQEDNAIGGYVIEDAGSTAELIYNLYKCAKVKIPPDIAFLILVTILYETRRLLFVGKYTLEAIYKLAKLSERPYSEALLLLKSEMDYSEKIARLKGASRVTLYAAKDLLIAITRVGAFESSVARAILELGADMAFVINDKDDFLRISARSKVNNIDLSKIMIEIAKFKKGHGGGHSKAAGLKIKGVKYEDLTKILISFLERYLSAKLEKLI